MIFKDKAHEDFYMSAGKMFKNFDCWHQAFFYVAGLNGDTRKHIRDIFNFDESCINPDGLNKPWQTGGSEKVSLMAFNLWNGYAEPDREIESTPYELFCTMDSAYFMEGIKLRYPEYSLEKAQAENSHMESLVKKLQKSPAGKTESQKSKDRAVSIR